MDRLIIASTVVLPRRRRARSRRASRRTRLELAAARSAKNLAVVAPDPLVLGAEVVFGQPHPMTWRGPAAPLGAPQHRGVCPLRRGRRARRARRPRRRPDDEQRCLRRSLRGARARVPARPRVGCPSAREPARPARLARRLRAVEERASCAAGGCSLLGFGAIGRRLAALLAPFEVDLRVLAPALRRRALPRRREGGAGRRVRLGGSRGLEPARGRGHAAAGLGRAARGDAAGRRGSTTSAGASRWTRPRRPRRRGRAASRARTST